MTFPAPEIPSTPYPVPQGGAGVGTVSGSLLMWRILPLSGRCGECRPVARLAASRRRQRRSGLGRLEDYSRHSMPTQTLALEHWTSRKVFLMAARGKTSSLPGQADLAYIGFRCHRRRLDREKATDFSVIPGSEVEAVRNQWRRLERNPIDVCRR